VTTERSEQHHPHPAVEHVPPATAGAGLGVPSSFDPEHRRRLLGTMLLVRRFEERCAELYQATKIRGFLHLYIGEEAIATGAIAALEPHDTIVATYREHGHALVRGLDPGAVMAEMFGKVEGCSRGRGGSMHLFDTSLGFYGGNGIVGGGLPIAVGLGLASRMQGTRSVCACFFGEGAVAEGEFHESMNLAALWKLPVLFLCENNLYAMGTALERSESQTELTVKAAGYGMPALTVDGMDPEAVEVATRAAVTLARDGGGPTFLELRTYRFRAHSMYDPELYRDKAEVREWREHDPIERYAARLRADGVLDDEQLAALEGEAVAVVDAAVAFAEAGTWEPLEDLTRFVYAESAPPGEEHR
jgi:pyruvate dehydrogenase E1 component alpha subunit